MQRDSGCEFRINGGTAIDPSIGISFIKKLNFKCQNIRDLVNKHLDGKRIIVTQNNIQELNTYFKIWDLLAEINDSKKQTDPSYDKLCTKESMLKVLNVLDVEEISFKNLTSMEQLNEILKLQNISIQKNIRPISNFLNNSYREINFASLFKKLSSKGGTDSLFDFIKNVNNVEEIRKIINESADKNSGDQIIIRLGENILDQYPLDKNQKTSYKNLKYLLELGKAWIENSKKAILYHDVQGLYQLVGRFALSNVANYLKSELETKGGDPMSVNAFLQKEGLSLSSVMKDLEDFGVPLELTLGNTQKGVVGLLSGNIGYITNRAVQKLVNENEEQTPKSAEVPIPKIKMTPTNVKHHPGVEINDISVEGNLLAVLVKMKPNAFKADLLMSPSGKVDMEAYEKEHHKQMIFSAPVAFSTGNRKMTEMAALNGNFFNYLVTVDGKDGIVMTAPNGELKIFDKSDLRKDDFSNFARDNAETMNASAASEKLKIMKDFKDFSKFSQTINSQRLSFVSNMLLIKGGRPNWLKHDGKTSRRFLLTFKDGSVGVINSSKDMSTSDLIAISLAAGAEQAVYMDTGMYDYATYYDPNGKELALGHQDTKDSTNRIVFLINNP